MKSRILSIGVTIVALFLVVAVIIMGTIMGLQYYFSTEIARDAMKKNFAFISADIKSDILAFDSASADAIALAEALNKNMSLDFNASLPVLAKILKQNPSLLSIDVSYEDGRIYKLINVDIDITIKTQYGARGRDKWVMLALDTNAKEEVITLLGEDLVARSSSVKKIDINPKMVEWYKSAMESNRVVRSEPHKLLELKEKGVIYSKGVDGEKKCVISVEVMLKSILYALERNRVTKNTNLYLFRKNGVVISRSEILEEARDINEFEKKDEFVPYDEIVKMATGDGEKETIITTGGKKQIAYVSSIDSKYGESYYLGAVVPLDEIMEEYEKKIKLALMISGGFALLLLPLVWYVAYVIVRPIKELVNESKKVAERKFDEVSGVKSSVYEVVILSESMVSMSQDIQAYQANLEERIKERTFELLLKTEKVTSLLDNSGEGFLSFKGDFLVEDEYSNECENMLGGEIAGKEIYKLLFPGDTYMQNLLIDGLNNIYAESDSYYTDILISLLPKECIVNEKILSLRYRLLDEQRAMMIITDMTENRKLQEKIEDEQKKLSFVVSAIKNRQDIIDCVESFRSFDEKGFWTIVGKKVSSRDKLSEIYREIHTYKGVFSQFSFPTLPKKLHSTEDALARLKVADELDEKMLQDIYTQSNLMSALEYDIDIIINAVGKEFFENAGSVMVDKGQLEKMENTAKQILSHTSFLPKEEVVTKALKIAEKVIHNMLNHMNSLKSDGVVKETLESMLHLRYLPVKEILSPYCEYAIDLANRLEKPIKPFEIEGGEIKVDPLKFAPFSKSLVHVFRNAIDHGIEDIESRLEAEKDELGAIECSVTNDQTHIILTIKDDGGGIDANKIREKLGAAGAAMSEQQAYMMIFSDSFSTKDEVSEISGRGIGLSAVKDEIEKLGGNIILDTKKGVGSTFMFKIPIRSVA